MLGSIHQTMNATDNEESIRDVIHARVDAIRNKDVNAVVRCFDPGAVAFTLAPPLVADQAPEGDLGKWFSTFSGPIGYEILDLQIVHGEEIAFAHCLVRIHGTKTDGEKPDVWIRETLGLHKTGGLWRILHLHDSVPFYMDGSFRAAIDLKP